MTFAEDPRGKLVHPGDLLAAGPVPYVWMGEVVVSIWGVPRATYDLDLTDSLAGSRVRARIDRRTAWVLGPAAPILHELVAARPTDRADVQNILVMRGVPDEPCSRAWAKQPGVEGALDEAIAQART